MVRCPWCGEEVETGKYTEHLEKCPEAARRAPTTLKQLFKGEVLDGFIEAARVRLLTEFVEKPKQGDFIKVGFLRYPQLVIMELPDEVFKVWDEWEIKWREIAFKDIERIVTPDANAPKGSPEEMASRIIEKEDLLKRLKTYYYRKT